MFDLCIYNVRIMNPSSNLDKTGAVCVKDGKIAAISEERQPAREEIDGKGLVLAPGFIDIHVHEDDYSDLKSLMLPEELSQCQIRTGVTTIVTGNCGMSSPDPHRYHQAVSERQLPVNCYMLIGNATLRRLSGLGSYDTATAEQIQNMCRLCDEALSNGAIGISFGLQYDPGTCYAEEKALCEVAARHNKIMAVHMRYDYPEKAEETLNEMICLAEETGVKMEISHLAANLYGDGVIEWTKRRIEESPADITCDMYPYNVWSTVLQSAVFDDGFDHFNFGVEDVEILTGEYAGQYCTQELFERLRASEEPVKVSCHNAMPEKDVDAVYCLPYCMLGSDGQMRRIEGGHLSGHPRGSGSPAKFLREYVREKQLFSLMEGIRKLTALPAERFALKGKGTLTVGADADLVLFDPDTIAEQSGFGIDVCAKPPVGIACVINGGEIRYRP